MRDTINCTRVVRDETIIAGRDIFLLFECGIRESQTISDAG